MSEDPLREDKENKTPDGERSLCELMHDMSFEKQCVLVNKELVLGAVKECNMELLQRCITQWPGIVYWKGRDNLLLKAIECHVGAQRRSKRWGINIGVCDAYKRMIEDLKQKGSTLALDAGALHSDNPLFWAVQHAEYPGPLCRTLIEHKANINHQDERNMTLLHAMYCDGWRHRPYYHEKIDLLKTLGINQNLLDHKGKKAMEYERA